MADSIISYIYALFSQFGYRHPLHPTQVHIPIGLIFGALLLGVMGKIRHRSQFSLAAWYCTVIAMIFTIPTIITGWMDWRHLFAGAMIYPFTVKFFLAAILLIFLTAGYLMGRTNGGTAKGLLIVYAAGLITAIGLGYFGGELVFSNRNTAATTDYKAGEDLYAANCNSCHLDGGNIMKPDLPVKHSTKTSDYDTFLSWVRSPRPPMPAYPSGALTDQEVRMIFDYITNVLSKS
jgi:uncharacterized membrane protein